MDIHDMPNIFSTKYNRWYTLNRTNIFKILDFVNVTEFCSSFIIPKFSMEIECDINRKLKSIKTYIYNSYGMTNTNSIFYRAAGGGYFLLIKNQKSITFINGELEDVKAEKEINRINKLRANHYKYYTEKDWSNPSNYDICINSDSLGIENAVDLICTSATKELVIK